MLLVEPARGRTSQKHSPGGYTIDIPRRTAISGGERIVSPRYTLLYFTCAVTFRVLQT